MLTLWVDEQIERNVKPDSQKSFGEQTKDKAKGQYENIAGKVQPESEK
jgi:hypothetical protein